jgi:rfaE bifunctional protein kinase chain/domain
MSTLLTLDDLNKKQLKSIDVVSMGHFNVLHPGHFRFLSFAASKGKNLCIILKEDDDLLENERAHYFSEEDRAAALSNFNQVSFVIVKKKHSLKKCLETINPIFFILGHEFEKNTTSEMSDLIKFANTIGIQTLFHSGDRNVGPSSLFQREPLELSKEDVALQSFKTVCRRRQLDIKLLAKSIKSFSSLTTLVIGDLVVDEFIRSEPLGLSSEAPVVVVKELEKLHYIGGAGVVASHVAALGPSCHFLSVSGDDQAREIALDKLNQYNVKSEVLIDENRPTTFKTRYMAANQKLFRVSRLMDTNIDPSLEDALIKKIWDLAPSLDNIIVSDFVYGVITDKILLSIQQAAKKYNLKLFGDLQCSSQVGNILKFQNFDIIFPTEKEARIAINNKDDGLEFVAQTVFEASKCKNLIIKLGSDGLIIYNKKDDFIETEHFPALSSNAIDVSGAGDSVLACMATGFAAGLGLMNSAALGSVVAACSVETMGNFPINIARLNQKLESLLPTENLGTVINS